MAEKLRIEFRYVDRKTCSRCRTTDKNVEKTVQGLRKALKKRASRLTSRPPSFL